VSVRARSLRGARGQHFLRSRRLAAELVRDAGIAPGDLVVDVGAGTGVLTRALLDAGAEVIAVELDPRLAAELRRRFAGRDLGVVDADARRWSWPREPFSVVANLPFTGSGEILGSLLRDPAGGLRRADVIVQWELAAKHAAVWPGTLRGTLWRAWFELAIVARLGRSAFAPPPQVDAAVLRITRRPRALLPPEEHEAYRGFLSDAFSTQAPLSRALRGVLTPREVRRLGALEGFDTFSYPRDLDARQWARVYAFSRSRSRSL
jgi:23S rRNA (adenine-N6)-dimethyltransferase